MTKVVWNPLGEGSVMKVEKDILKYKKLHEDAIAPTRSHEGDLGYDLYALEDATIGFRCSWRIPTGIAFQFPDGWGGLLKDRSSMAAKGFSITGGVIDNGYTGEIIVVMSTTTDNNDYIKKGQKIAQMVLVPVANLQLQEVDELIAADERGDRGFGSTGK